MGSEKTNEGRPDAGKAQQAADATATSPDQAIFDAWVDRRLKSMHDAVLDEAIPEEFLRILGDGSPGPTTPQRSTTERGTSDDPHGRPDQPGHGRPSPDKRRN